MQAAASYLCVKGLKQGDCAGLSIVQRLCWLEARHHLLDGLHSHLSLIFLIHRVGEEVFQAEAVFVQLSEAPAEWTKTIM